MSTYPMGGSLPQYGKYLGEFVPDYNAAVQYFYIVVAYDRNRIALTSDPGFMVRGPSVLDGDHAIQINWSPVIGAYFFNVYKGIGAAPPPNESAGIWWNASGTETGVLDVGYPCTTRNSFLNPGNSPVFNLQMPVPQPPIDPCSEPNATNPCGGTTMGTVPDPCTGAALASEGVDYGL